jgi:hypothetical protein
MRPVWARLRGRALPWTEDIAMNVGDIQCDHPGCKARITLFCPWLGQGPVADQQFQLNATVAAAAGWEVTPTDAPRMDFQPVVIDGFTVHSTDVANMRTLCPEHRE